jgi:hypothetical protein
MHSCFDARSSRATPTATDRRRRASNIGSRVSVLLRERTPMFRHATAAVLLVGLMLQPLSAAVCADECGSHRRQQSSEPPAEHCAEETSESPGPPKPERPTHESSNCGHSESICAALQGQPTEPSAPPIVQLAVLPPLPSALFGAPVRPSMLVRQSTSPPGCSVRITPLRI